jgi:DNA-directed RNA polymerase subunit RPC12/RpoP
MNIQSRSHARPPVPQIETKAYVYCPICTHTVEGIVVTAGKSSKVKPGQKCSRCSAALDPAYIMRMDQAA